MSYTTGRENHGSTSGGCQDFPLRNRAKIASVVHAASCIERIGAFPRKGKRPGSEANQSLPSSGDD
jgi:hypothetical protein